MTHINKYLVFALLVFTSCIEPFHPDTDGSNTVKYVVDGRITDQEGYQKVTVSMTSTFKNPNFLPLSFCKVKVIDNEGNIFNLNEQGGGVYKVWIGKEYLYPGKSFQVNITTPTGVEIVSDFDKMTECPDVDSIYFTRKDMPTTNPSIMREGIQFYIDIDRKNTNSNFFRWEITETWEHHSSYPITWHKAGMGDELETPPDYSRFTCWTTQVLNDVFTLSTDKVVQNTYNMKALHYVDNMSQRLTYGYSALVSQIALSEPAFIFWDKLRNNGDQQGGLTTSQPFSVRGNLKCITNPEIDVLGFFSASTVKTKRIFVRNIEDFHTYIPQCVPPHIPLPKEQYRYLIEINGVKYILDIGCVECDYMSGTTRKPDFWPY